ncbi:hypothetical protein GQX74_010898 [Glossina fuscipes]|nr:hypothetical protein GQX74_010898 [Glossina fuscipes]
MVVRLTEFIVLTWQHTNGEPNWKLQCGVWCSHAAVLHSSSIEAVMDSVGMAVVLIVLESIGLAGLLAVLPRKMVVGDNNMKITVKVKHRIELVVNSIDQAVYSIQPALMHSIDSGLHNIRLMLLLEPTALRTRRILLNSAAVLAMTVAYIIDM